MVLDWSSNLNNDTIQYHVLRYLEPSYFLIIIMPVIYITVLALSCAMGGHKIHKTKKTTNSKTDGKNEKSPKNKNKKRNKKNKIKKGLSAQISPAGSLTSFPSINSTGVDETTELLGPRDDEDDQEKRSSKKTLA